jgi:hypothetical protein
MKKRVVALLLISLFSCGKKEIQLPQLGETLVADVKDHSPIYMFFETNGNDTLIDVNRSNSISSTNWLFHIDKRLPLKLVIPEIQKLQAKKEKSSHKKEGSENYFTFMDSKKMTLAFLPFTKVVYEQAKPNFGVVIFHNKNGIFVVNGIEVDKENLQNHLDSLQSDKPNKFLFCFDKEISFEKYLEAIVYLNEISVQYPFLQLSDTQYVY